MQRTDGSGIVDIAYSLFDVNNDLSTISLMLSQNSGATYQALSQNVSGDIGANITGGTKHIIWNATGTAYDAATFRIRILADDGTTFGAVATPIFSPAGGTYILCKT